MCSYLLHNLFWKTRKPGSVDDSKRSKTGNSLRGEKKNYATPTNEELGQTSNWSKLVAAYLPVARLTILDRLVHISVTAVRVGTWPFILRGVRLRENR